jgi:hypothetical protein
MYHTLKADERNASQQDEDSNAQSTVPQGTSSNAADASEDPSTRGEFALLRALSQRPQGKVPVMRLDLFDEEDEDDSGAVVTAATIVDANSNLAARKEYTEGLQAAASIFDDTLDAKPANNGVGAHMDVLAMLDETVNHPD